MFCVYNRVKLLCAFVVYCINESFFLTRNLKMYFCKDHNEGMAMIPKLNIGVATNRFT